MKERCLIMGAGAIGKSVAGYIFNRAGFHVVFGDIADAVIADVNERGEYRVYTNDTDYEVVQDVSAVHIGEEDKVLALLEEVRYLCTSVGPRGIGNVLRLAAEGVKRRAAAGNTTPLCVIFCENIANVMELAEAQLKEALTEEEYGLVKLVHTSIERMTKAYVREDKYFDVLGEKFIPIILSKEDAGDDKLLADTPNLFMAVDSVEAYYLRKIYTNNMGHGVLGYVGRPKGYKSVSEAARDPEINALLNKALSESGRMLVAKYGFTEEAMQAHLTELVNERYMNEALSDPLDRVARDPMRKLGPKERLIGPARKCVECGFFPEGIMETVNHALHYVFPDDESSVKLQEMISEKGIGYAAETVCGLTEGEELYKALIDNYNK